MKLSGSFDVWMADTYAALELIKFVGNPYNTLRTYESPHFSYAIDDNGYTTYKYNRVLDDDEEVAPIQYQSLAYQQAQAMISCAVNSGYYTTQAHPNAMSQSSNDINCIIITTNRDHAVRSVQWIRKTNSGLVYATVGANFGYQDGGVVLASMLFLPEDRILVNDKVYSNETPDAFTHDISIADTGFRYLDLVLFREKFDEPLY